VEVLWVVMPCSIATEYQHFQRHCCLHLQSEVLKKHSETGSLVDPSCGLTVKVILELKDIGYEALVSVSCHLSQPRRHDLKLVVQS